METFKDSKFYLLELPNRFRVIQDFCKKYDIEFKIREAVHFGHVNSDYYVFMFDYYNPNRNFICFEIPIDTVDIVTKPMSLKSKELEEMRFLECTMICKIKKHFKIDFYDEKENWEKIKIVYVLSHMIPVIDFNVICEIGEMFNYVPSLMVDYVHKGLFKKDSKK